LKEVAVSIKNAFVVAIRTTLVTLVLTGLVYPLVLTGLAQVLFSARANGSVVRDERRQIVGSELIGQGFNSPGYFQPRPSAAGDKGYDATASSGSNLGPTSQKLKDRVAAQVKRLRAHNPDAPGPLPAELVTASASGLDPHLSPTAALWQTPRIARARKIATARVRAVLVSAIEGRDLGFLGEPRVNVLLVNIALDRQFGRPSTASPKEGGDP
jgi:K+-transporting ATPase ATPase C chain